MKILVVAAHPDDEVLGAGGAIARHTEKGDQVTVMILGSGLSSRLEQPELLEETDLADLRNHARKAAGVLGVSDLRLFDFPDNRFDRVDLLDIVKRVESVVNELEPEVVYTHFQGDLNIDHQVTARATLTACRPLPGSSVNRILAFEVVSATGWGFFEQPFMPTVFTDISATLPKKIAAMDAYSTEVREFPHPRSKKALRAIAEGWGARSGVAAAEPFMLVRERN